MYLLYFHNYWSQIIGCKVGKSCVPILIYRKQTCGTLIFWEDYWEVGWSMGKPLNRQNSYKIFKASYWSLKYPQKRAYILTIQVDRVPQTEHNWGNSTQINKQNFASTPVAPSCSLPATAPRSPHPATATTHLSFWHLTAWGSVTWFCLFCRCTRSKHSRVWYLWLSIVLWESSLLLQIVRSIAVNYHHLFHSFYCWWAFGSLLV